MATILEALENAEHNIKAKSYFQLEVAEAQVHNARVLLEKGYGIYTEIEPLVEEYKGADNVPEKKDE